MFFSIELLDLVLYCVQQLGVMLSVGSATIVLIAYIMAMRDGKIVESEAHFSRIVHRALGFGILLMVLSGIAITSLHGMTGQIAIVFAPVFLFKWLLIIGLIVVYLTQKGKPFSHFAVEGLLGATWYVLFLVHILAPITSWINLLMLYVLFVAGFEIVWLGIVMATRGKLKLAPKPIVQKVVPPKITPVPAPVVHITKIVKPMQQPVAPAKVAEPKPIAPPPLSKPPIVVVPIAAKIPDPPQVIESDPHHSLWLPAIHIMPKSQEVLDQKGHLIPKGATKHA